MDVNVTDQLGRNALHLAVTTRDYDVVKLLLTHGVKPNVKDAIGMTPLSLCLMRRPSLKIAELLFEHGAVILPRFNKMDTGLFIQFVMVCKPTVEELRIIHLLVKKGALVDDPDAPGGRQALHFAAMSNNCTLIATLLKLGADPFLTNHRNQTPREVALDFKCKEAAKMLDQYEEFSLGSCSSVYSTDAYTTDTEGESST